MRLFKRNRSNNSFYSKDTYVPQIMVSAWNKYSEPEHREKRVEYDPIAYNLVVKTADLITSRPPIFLDDNMNEMLELKQQWEERLYNDLLNQDIVATRTHGFGVTEALKEPIGKRDFFVHTPKNIIQINYNKSFNIAKYVVMPTIEEGDKIVQLGIPIQHDLEPDKVIHHWIGKFKLNQQGVGTLKPVWHSIVRFTEILESMTMYDSRVGHGMLMVAVDPDRYQGEMNALNNAVKNFNNRRYLILKTNTDNSAPEFKFIGAEGTKVNFPADLITVLQVIAASSGFPVRYLIGDPKGAQSAAKEDTIAVYENLKSIFGEYKDYIRDILLMQEDGEALNKSVKFIEFDHGGHLPEDDEEGNIEEEEEELEEGNPKDKHKENNPIENELELVTN